MLGGTGFSFLHQFFPFFFPTYPQRMPGDLVPSFRVGTFHSYLIYNNSGEFTILCTTFPSLLPDILISPPKISMSEIINQK